MKLVQLLVGLVLDRNTCQIKGIAMYLYFEAWQTKSAHQTLSTLTHSAHRSTSYIQLIRPFQILSSPGTRSTAPPPSPPTSCTTPLSLSLSLSLTQHPLRHRWFLSSRSSPRWWCSGAVAASRSRRPPSHPPAHRVWCAASHSLATLTTCVASSFPSGIYNGEHNEINGGAEQGSALPIAHVGLLCIAGRPPPPLACLPLLGMCRDQG
jgi:hypothetical protein